MSIHAVFSRRPKYISSLSYFLFRKLTLPKQSHFNRLMCTSCMDLSCPPIVPRPNVVSKCFTNEPTYQYLSGSGERSELEFTLAKVCCPITDIPIIIGDEEINTEDVEYLKAPFDKELKIASYSLADSEIIEKAIRNSVNAQRHWDKSKFEDRIKIFEKAANLIAGPYRQKLNAAAMLCQGKTAMQAEIDACEFIDLLRFNCFALAELLRYEPLSPEPTQTMNYYRYRGCEGFWAAMSPFNSTSIAGNLATAPLFMGNSVLWKPCRRSILSNWFIFEILREAGLPPGVLNFVPSEPVEFGKIITKSKHLAGINFTGSTKSFNEIFKQVGTNIENYRSYPRFVAELGGKNYHFVHCTADITQVINCTVRAAFEYSGQKCSACSIIYVPESLLCDIKTCLIKAIEDLIICHPTNFTAFTSAVIDKGAFDRVQRYIDDAKSSSCAEVLAGGCCDNAVGYYVEPTLIQCNDHKNKLFKEEIFGPVLTIYPYDDCDINSILTAIVNENPYALSASIFAQNQEFLCKSYETLKMTAGNFYINDKCTGSVVGQQPFGGSRLSGTNDKAGGPYHILRYANPQAIKQSFCVPTSIDYPYMCYV